VLSPAPAFAGTPLPPNLMLAMAARPAVLPTQDLPTALAATGPQLFPFTRSMQQVRTQAGIAAVKSAGETLQAAKDGQFTLNPRLRSIFSEQRQVSITTKRELATTFYNVRRGDSLYSIAADVLGSGSRWRQIYEANKDKVGAGFLLQPGQRLAVATRKPSAAFLAKAPAAQNATSVAAAIEGQVAPQEASVDSTIAARSAKSYVVVSGDNLYSIASKQLGNATRWREIVSLNKALLNGKTLIFPNQWLVLPNQQV
jgi:nucleoid-associated protein YgaU